MSAHELHLQWFCKKKGESAGFSTEAPKSGNGTSGVCDTCPLCPVCDSRRRPHLFSLGPRTYSLCHIPCRFIQIQEENHTQVSEEPHVAVKASGWNAAPVIPSEG